MGKKTKTGKGRLDKFYHLAKEQGFRARSAFKLTQLAKQYNLFNRTSVCVDLCGAPGGWSQVAIQAMPRGSKVICVDLVAIKPIKGVVTIQSDITTQTCRNLIKAELQGKSHVCDLVLNDGAPNVGAAWSKDAYNQAELTLHAFQLACDLLRPGGTFVTKVFRSSDYNSLLWVFQQLFTKVESTKPSASRAVSAEIFVVCQGFKAPGKVDPKFFNPKFVFMSEGDVEEGEEEEMGDKKTTGAVMDKPSSLSGLLKAVAKRNRSGYATGDDYRTASIDELLASKNPAEMLIKCHKIIVTADRKESLGVPDDLLPYFEDLKVLGKGELYSIMKWRTNAVHALKTPAKVPGEAETPESESSDDSDAGADVELEGTAGDDARLLKMLKAQQAEEKRELKKQRIKDKKSLMRKKMSLDNGVAGIAETTSASFEPDLFHLPTMRERSRLIGDALQSETQTVEVEEMADPNADLTIPSYEIVERGTGDRLKQYEEQFAGEHELGGRRAGAAPGERATSKGKKITRRQLHMAEWAANVDALGDEIDKKAYARHAGLRADDAASSDDSDIDEMTYTGNESFGEDSGESEIDDAEPTAAATKTVTAGKKEAGTTGESVLSSRWFSNPIFGKSGAGDSEDEEEAEGSGFTNELLEGDLPVIPMSEKQEKKRKRKEKAEKLAATASKGKKKNGGLPSDLVGDGNNEIEIVPMERPSLDEIAEVQAMGSLLIHKKSRRELIEAGFSRHVRDDPEDLPDWFVEEEEQFNRKTLPLTKELMSQYRAKLREINARPIRKEAEAQGRRKRKVTKKLASLKRQANSLVDGGDDPFGGSGSIHKAKQIVKNIKEVKREGKRKTVFLAVQKRGGPSKQISGDGGRGAKVAMIDRRLKKDRRGERNATRRNKGKKGGR